MEQTTSAARDAALALYTERAAQETRQRFGFDGLRPHQAEVLQHVLAGRDCLAVLPTGSGKSLCYALPALVRPGLVLVVSPLIALIRDQAQKFAQHGIGVASLDSLQSGDEKDAVWQRLANPEQSGLKLLLVSPERLARHDFRERLRSLDLQLVAIDEAHCISHWGSHFRPDYRHLGQYLEDLGSADGGRVQKLAVTATATHKVRDDIARTLRLADPATVWADFARANLRLSVVKADKVHEQLSAILQVVLASEGAGIVYVPTRKSARDIHRMLVDARVPAALYHAGLPPASRHAAQRAFMEGAGTGRTRVVVATHAFGMGIDKADIRFVHHAGLPGSIEQYVQEIGRAGRDGAPAQCTLVYGPRDYYVQKFMIDKSYPDAELLRTVLAEARAALAAACGIGLSAPALVRVLRETHAATEDDLTAALEVLAREGLLDQMRGGGVWGGGDGESEVLFGEGNPQLDAEVFAEYPLRKHEAMARLEGMRAFVAEKADRMQLLDDYFRR